MSVANGTGRAKRTARSGRRAFQTVPKGNILNARGRGPERMGNLSGSWSLTNNPQTQSFFSPLWAVRGKKEDLMGSNAIRSRIWAETVFGRRLAQWCLGNGDEK